MTDGKRSTAFHVIVGWLLASLLATFLFADLLWRHRVSHLRFQDLECDYMGLFAFQSNLWSGGPKLWNSYDQVPLMLNHVAGGLYSVAQTFVVVLYPMFKWFVPMTGEAFQVVASTVPFYLYILLVVAGLVLLAERFSKRTGVILLSSVVGATILSGPLFMGVGGRHLVFMYPLLAHFILRFFETLGIRDFAALAIAMLLCVYMSPFIAGYVYQALHFLLLAGLLWAWLRKEDSLRQKMFRRETWTFSRRDWGQLALLALLGLVVAGPLLWQHLGTNPAYAFGEEHARTQNVFSPIEYFRRPFFYLPPSDFVYQSLNYKRMDVWWMSWSFLGVGVLLFAGLGAVLGRDPRRHVFTAAVALLLLINAPRLPDSLVHIPGFAVHVVNALTNVGKFIVRSYHEPAAFAIPYFLVPLVACGLEALCDVLDGVRPRLEKPSWAQISAPLGVLAVVLVLFALASLAKNWRGLASYRSMSVLLLCSLICAAGIVMVLFSRRPSARWPRAIALALLLILFALDARNLRTGSSEEFYRLIRTGTFSLAGMSDASAALLDYQNPEIMPFRRYLRVEEVGQIPNPFIVNSINQQGVFYRFQNMHKYFQPIKQMSDTRHSSFSLFWQRPEMRQYFADDQRIVFAAPLAVAEGTGNFTEIVKRGWQRTVVAIDSDGLPEGKSFQRSLPVAAPAAFPAERLLFNRASLDWKRVTTIRGPESDLFVLDLPADFPAQLATTPFTEDRRSLSLTFDGRALSPVQGKPVVPFTFDVQNLSTRKVALALPPGSEPTGHKAELSYESGSVTGLSRLLHYDSDNLEFEYLMQDAGWVVFHYPFDPKFVAYVDGASTRIRRANTGFMAIEVPPGRHEIALRYWPGTLLRPWLLLAYLAALIAFVTVLARSIRARP